MEKESTPIAILTLAHSLAYFGWRYSWVADNTHTKRTHTNSFFGKSGRFEGLADYGGDYRGFTVL